ncbi:MAG TPA: nucleotidyltransferase domain-containing protein [Herpetosiphonaceae bacterium]
MPDHALFPTRLHQQAAEAIVAFFQPRPGVDAVLLVNSCARGVATPESDLDIAVLVSPLLPPAERLALEQEWQQIRDSAAIFQQLRASGQFTGVHLDLFDGQFAPESWDDGGGPDGFELGIGNEVAYSRPLWEANTAFRDLRDAWLPYYDESLRQQRLAMVRDACHYDLDHVPFYVARGLHFQAFDRLYKALQEFLQALGIAHRTYPIAYNKWIREQVESRLGLPELYTQLPPILEIPRLESHDVTLKAADLRQLLERWTIR